MTTYNSRGAACNKPRPLCNMGVTALLINETESISGGEFRVTEVGVSYLADNILFLRYLEVNGELHKAIGVLKKRMSDFQNSLRELEITRYGLKVGKPLIRIIEPEEFERLLLACTPPGEMDRWPMALALFC